MSYIMENKSSKRKSVALRLEERSFRVSDFTGATFLKAVLFHVYNIVGI